jgi:hypothetical protein
MSHGSRFHHHRRHRRHHHHIRVAIVVNGTFAVELIPNGVIHMAYTLDAGKTENFAIEVLDQNGQPITAPVFDAPPSWADSNPAAQTLTAAADGLTASALGLDAGGQDIVQMQCAIGGASFTATVDGTVTPAAPKQVPTTVNIVATPA